MKKAFASVLGLVALAGAAVGALPASASTWGAITNGGTSTVYLGSTLTGNSGTVTAGTGNTGLANSSGSAALTIVSSLGAQYQSLVTVFCTSAGKPFGASDYSVGFSNTATCPTGSTLSSSAALISVN